MRNWDEFAYLLRRNSAQMVVWIVEHVSREFRKLPDVEFVYSRLADD